jgi:catechol 2,3-dioxygenase-like lactoylglutathione lyase family enzyme
MRTRGAAMFLIAAAIAPRPITAHAADPVPVVTKVDTVGLTVSDMDRAVDFYTSVLTFEKISDVEAAGRAYELMEGVFGARMRIVRLRLGGETIELTEYLAPKGRPMPADVRPNDLIFQHVAIIVSDMDQAYARLWQHHVQHASTGPQRLPAWNANAGGISAFYFRDPDGHFLEILHFPADKGLEKWHRADRLFLGIDHTAIVVSDTDRTLRFYRDMLGMRIAGESENYDTEQEHLNNVFGARLRITAIRAEAGPGIELLEYLAPRDGRPAPLDLKSNDVAHWQTTLAAPDPARILESLRLRLFALVSPSPVALPAAADPGLQRALLVRDPDGHGVRIAFPAARNAGAGAASKQQED